MTDVTQTRPGARIERVIGSYTKGRTGPTLICVCGVHGNEPAGGVAAEKILDGLCGDEPETFKGRFVALTGNIAAKTRPDGACRYIDRDLNRLFTAENVGEARALDPSRRSPEQREMVELLDALEAEFATADGPVYVLDLHTFSSRGFPFGAIEDSLAARAFAKRFPIPFILGMEEELHGLFIDYVGRTYAHVAMIFEGGVHHEEQAVDAHLAAIRIALSATGIVPDSDIESPLRVLARDAGVRSGRFYDIRHCEPIGDPSFEMVEGIESADPVRRGCVVANELGAPRAAPVGGIMFLPNRNAGRRAGDDGFFIIQRVDLLSMWLSQRLRQRLIHRLAPHVLPGVRRIPDHPDRLLVAPEIAVIFKRELFHLLGYRIERRGEVEHRSLGARAWLGLGAALRAVSKVARGLFHGGERGVLPHERPDDWIVARRTLDMRDAANHQ